MKKILTILLLLPLLLNAGEGEGENKNENKVYRNIKHVITTLQYPDYNVGGENYDEIVYVNYTLKDGVLVVNKTFGTNQLFDNYVFCKMNGVHVKENVYLSDTNIMRINFKVTK